MLELKNIYKDYYIDKKPLHVLKDINISFPRQQFVSLLGPSGCGKTTTLNIIGGLDQYTKGDLIIEGRSTKDFTSEDWDAYRNVRIGFVFQSYNLISHLNVRQNVEMGMQLAGIGAEERKQRATEALESVGLGDVIEKDVNKLSGGQMQRVAIARAIVNNPDIILADEPTGALDTETSEGVLDLLKEISKEKLVIMVTHNEKLAEKYSNRIIRMLDGVITSDSAPHTIDYSTSTRTEKKPKRTKMSFWTALKSSMRNISTKKGRTIMTSIAASFGIIGVGLVLAVSNGFQNYVNRLEASTLSIYPLGIYASTVTLADDFMEVEQPDEFPEEEHIIIRDDTAFAGQILQPSVNIITDDQIRELEERYLDTGDAASVLKNYSMNMHLSTMRPTEDGGQQFIVNYDTNPSRNGTIIPMPGGNFHQLFGSEEYITSYYDVLSGEYPDNKNEVVLVLNRYNQLSYSQLRNLGIVPNFEDDEDISTLEPIAFDDVIGKKYHVFTNDEFFEKAGTVEVADYGVLGDNFTAADYMSLKAGGTNKTIQRYQYPDINELYTAINDPAIEKGTELEVVGILRMKEGSSYTDLMETGLCYTPELADYIAQENIDSEFTANLETSFTQNFPDSMPADVKTQLSAAFPEYASSFVGLKKIIESTKESFLAEGIEIDPLTLAYTILNQGLPDGAGGAVDLFTFYNTVNKDRGEAAASSSDYVIAMTDYLSDAKEYGATFTHEDENQVLPSERFFMEVFDNLIPYPSMDPSDVDFQVKYRDLIYSIYDSIAIFPASSEGKAAILAGIDEWNAEKNREWTEMGKKGNSPYYISVTDILSSVSESLAILVQVISIVLLIFSSISLVTAAVMIGIITSASVIERTKEIGVLRALGARKRDITTLFQAETFIIGIAAAIIGVLVVELISLPINLILNNQFAFAGLGAIADLKWWHALVLIGINLGITMLASLLPSRNAAKKEPVDALRSE